MAFYLKYRPKTIAELDLDFVREQLGKILSSNNFPHAFLFSGPKGLGKTSAARILAKTINCKARGLWQVADSKKKKAVSRKPRAKRPPATCQVEPCNKCEVCQSINKGTALDILEIDAASNRGIDDIRNLKEGIKLAPNSLTYKVYVIDEVHMLTTEAFNALLKTLEEPPPHVVFVLATTEPHKLPETIISRCMHIRFQKATVKQIERSLQRIVRGEKLKIDKPSLELIARHSNSSFRDAAKILEQLSYEGKKIDLEKVETLVKQSGEFNLLKWTEFLLKKDVEGCFKMLGEAVEKGVDLKWLVIQTLEKLRQFLLGKYGLARDKRLATCLADRQVGRQLSTKDLIHLMELVNKAGVDLKSAVVPQLPLELAIVEWSESKIKNAKLKMQNCNSKSNNNRKYLSVESTERHTEFISASNQSKILKQVQDDNSNIKTKIEDIAKNWGKVLRSIRPHNHSVEALLRSSRPWKIKSNVLIIEAFYRFHKDKLETEKCRRIVEKVLSDVFENKIKVKYVLGEKKVKSKTKKETKKNDGDFIKEAEEIFLQN